MPIEVGIVLGLDAQQLKHVFSGDGVHEDTGSFLVVLVWVSPIDQGDRKNRMEFDDVSYRIEFLKAKENGEI